MKVHRRRTHVGFIDGVPMYGEEGMTNMFNMVN